MRNANPYAVLVASLLVGLGPWVNAAPDWNSLLTTANIGAALGIVGGVVLAWFGTSPIKPKQP